MFAIGDKEWPGISKLVEECGEVLQVCGKLMGSRGEVQHFDGTNLKTRLEEELGDLQAAINFVASYCGLDQAAIHRRVVKKIGLFDGWHIAEAGPCTNPDCPIGCPDAHALPMYDEEGR